MPTSLTQIQQFYSAIDYRPPPALDSATVNSYLPLDPSVVQNAIEAEPYTQNIVNPVIREYQAAFDRVPDQAGIAYWVQQFGQGLVSIGQISTIFANSTEFGALYGGANATTPANATLVTAFYNNVLQRVPDAAGLNYWVNSGLNAAQLLQAFSQSPEFVNDTNSAIITFQNLEVAGNPPTSGTLFEIPQTFTLTTGIDNISTSSNNALFNAPVGQNPIFLTPANTLNTGDVLHDTGADGTLAATFGVGANITATINGIATWTLTDSVAGAVTILGGVNVTGLTAVNDVNSIGNLSVGTLAAPISSQIATVGLTNLPGTHTLTINEVTTATSVAVNATNVGTTQANGAILELGSNGANGVQNWTVNSASASPTGANFLEIGTLSDTAAKTLTVTGAAPIVLSASSAADFHKVTTIDATAATGNVFITGADSANYLQGITGVGLLTNDTVLTSAKFGSGNDTLDISNLTSAQILAAGNSFDGGAGADTIVLNNAAIQAAALATVTNFEIVGDSNPSGTINAANLPVGATELQFWGLQTGGVTINNAPDNFTLDVQHFGVGAVTLNAAGTGTSDTGTLIVGDATSVNTGFINPFIENGYETFNIVSNGPGGPAANFLTGVSQADTFNASPGGLLTLDISGAQSLTTNALIVNGQGGTGTINDTDTGILTVLNFQGGGLSEFATNAAVINASTSGGVVIEGADSAFVGTTGDSITGSATANNTLAGSEANDIFTGGTGTDLITTDGGADTINLGATHSADQINLFFGNFIGGGGGLAASITSGSDFANPGSWGVAPAPGTPVGVGTATPFTLFTHIGATDNGTSADMSTVANFVSGATGDILNFSVGSWAFGFVNNGLSTGDLSVGHQVAAGHDAVIAVQNPGTTVGAGTTVIELTGTFANANAVALALGNNSLTPGGSSYDLNFAGAPGGGGVFDSHILVAYQTSTGTNIADVDVNGTNTHSTSDNVVASDVVHLTGVNVASLNNHNIHFVA